MNSNYTPIIIFVIIAIVAYMAYCHFTKKEPVRTRRVPQNPRRRIDDDDVQDIVSRTFRRTELPANNFTQVSSNMLNYYADTDRIVNIIGSRGGNASFRSGRTVEGFDNVENGDESIEGIFVSLENKMYPIKGNLIFSKRTNDDTFFAIDPVDVANADGEMNNIAPNVMPYGQGNEEDLGIDTGENLGSMKSNNMPINENYPQQNYDASLVTPTPMPAAATPVIIRIPNNTGAEKTNANGEPKVVEIFTRIG